MCPTKRNSCLYVCVLLNDSNCGRLRCGVERDLPRNKMRRRRRKRRVDFNGAVFAAPCAKTRWFLQAHSVATRPAVSCRVVLYRTSTAWLLLSSLPLCCCCNCSDQGGRSNEKPVGRSPRFAAEPEQSPCCLSDVTAPVTSTSPPLFYLPSIAPKSSPSFLSLPILIRFLFPYSFFFFLFFAKCFCSTLQLKSKKGLEGLGRGLLLQQEQDERRPSLSLSLACDEASVPDASAALSCRTPPIQPPLDRVCVCDDSYCPLKQFSFLIFCFGVERLIVVTGLVSIRVQFSFLC